MAPHTRFLTVPIRVARQELENPLKHALDGPSPEPLEDRVPFPERFRQVAPGSADPGDPQHSLQEGAIPPPRGRPGSPTLPGKCGATRSHCSSLNIRRSKAASILEALKSALPCSALVFKRQCQQALGREASGLSAAGEGLDDAHASAATGADRGSGWSIVAIGGVAVQVFGTAERLVARISGGGLDPGFAGRVAAGAIVLTWGASGQGGDSFMRPPAQLIYVKKQPKQANILFA